MSNSSWENRIRVRSCGVLIENDKVLLVEIVSPISKNRVWMPPGGEVEFGETLEEAVKREFLEETGLSVSVKERLHVNELVQQPFHAIEIYFSVKRESGELELGSDPELDDDEQILRATNFFSKKELSTMNVTPAFIADEL